MPVDIPPPEVIIFLLVGGVVVYGAWIASVAIRYGLKKIAKR